eukprot:1292594-Prymnesium_polylepis.1
MAGSYVYSLPTSDPSANGCLYRVVQPSEREATDRSPDAVVAQELLSSIVESRPASRRCPFSRWCRRPSAGGPAPSPCGQSSRPLGGGGVDGDEPLALASIVSILRGPTARSGGW